MFSICGPFHEWLTPLEALEIARASLMLDSMLGPSNNKPGYLIGKLSRYPNFANAISKLTSDMTRNERYEPVLGYLSWHEQDKKAFRETCLKWGNEV